MRFDFIAFWNETTSTWQAGLTTHSHQYQGAQTLEEAVWALKTSLDPYSEWFKRLKKEPEAEYVPNGDERDIDTAYGVIADDGDSYNVEPSKKVRYIGQIRTPSLFKYLKGKWLECEADARDALLLKLLKDAEKLEGEEAVMLQRLVALMQNIQNDQ